MAQGVSLLLHSVGIVPSAKTSRSAKSTVLAHFRRISGAKQIRDFCWVQEPVMQQTIRNRLEQYHHSVRPTGYRIVRGPEGRICLTRLVSIEAEQATEDVYSIEVEGTETFVTDHGLVVHNCFPKDLAAFIRISEKLGYDFELLKAVEKVNADQRRFFIKKIEEALWNISGKTIAVWGLSFKPNTDDMRYAPSIEILSALAEGGARIRAYDPKAMEKAREALPQIIYAKSAYAAARGADCLVILTEWEEFKNASLKKLKSALVSPLVIDGRNLFDPAVMARAGFRYVSIGRKTPP
jgi:UDPglucose 6-dehydrogenase